MKALLLMGALALPANAEGIDMMPLYDNAPAVSRVHKVSAPVRKSKPKRKKGHSFRPAPVAGKPVPLATEAVTRCLAPVRVVGSQDVRPDAAESSAQKAWMEAVRWTHGEAFQDFQNAENYQKRCSRSSIGEALGQYFTRCEITASPCRPGMVEGSK